jgi:hypothetical protein
MVNWTDKIIHWNQLGSTELKRLITTWGKDEKFIAKYDKAHGFESSPTTKTVAKPKSAPAPTVPAKAVKKAVPVAKKVVRQKHTGANGEIKFVEHRNLYIGFFGGRVVVTKRTAEACKEVLRTDYGVE